MKISTLVLTRFNLPLAFTSPDRDLGVVPGKTNLDRSWLDKRVQLFHEYCSPSMIDQLDRSRKWCILFDPETPPDIVDQVCNSSGIEPFFATSQTQALQRVLKTIELDDYIQTIRLDSDDSLSEDFFSTVDAILPGLMVLSESSPVALSFQNGCEFDTQSGTFYDRFYPGNPFVSVIERPESIENVVGVFKTAHYNMHRVLPLLSIPTDDPMWCINVHGGNVANEIKGTASDNNYASRFGFDGR